MIYALALSVVVGASADGGSIVLSKFNADAGITQLLDEPTQRMVRDASRVEVFRLKNDAKRPELARRAVAPEEHIVSFAVQYRREVRRPEVAARLRALTLDPNAYAANADTGRCAEFEPRVVLRFVADSGSVDLLLSLSCGQLAFVKPKATVLGPVAKMATAEWVTVAKAALPDDSYIQTLEWRP